MRSSFWTHPLLDFPGLQPQGSPSASGGGITSRFQLPIFFERPAFGGESRSFLEAGSRLRFAPLEQYSMISYFFSSFFIRSYLRITARLFSFISRAKNSRTSSRTTPPAHISRHGQTVNSRSSEMTLLSAP